MKRLIKRLIAGAVLVSLLGAATPYGLYWWTEARRTESTDNAYVRGDITAIGPQVAGYVAEILVDDNQVVRAGDVLIRIADVDYRAQVDRARAAVAEAEAAADNLARRKDLQGALIREAEAAVRAARADVELARASSPTCSGNLSSRTI